MLVEDSVITIREVCNTKEETLAKVILAPPLIYEKGSGRREHNN